jgi:hypothetical protein
MDQTTGKTYICNTEFSGGFSSIEDAHRAWQEFEQEMLTLAKQKGFTYHGGYLGIGREKEPIEQVHLTGEPYRNLTAMPGTPQEQRFERTGMLQTT